MTYRPFKVPSPAGRLAAQVSDGPLVVLQHGLCGDAGQPAEVVPQGVGHAVLNCRGHGGSPAGDPAALTIAHFTDDLAEMIALLPSAPLAVGGISMGAAMSLRLAVTRPDLVPALILSRPAWVVEAAPANMQPNAEVGRVIATGGTWEDFAACDTAKALAVSAPDNLASLRGFFAREPLDITAALLTRISADGPGVSADEVAALRIPTLILASAEDFVHPLAHAHALAALIQGAQFIEVPPKGRGKAAHIAACQAAILTFLKGLPHAPAN